MGPKQCYQRNRFNERPGFIHEWSSEAGVQVLCLSPFLGFRVPHRNGERSRGFAVAAAAVYGGGARGCESLQSRHPHRSRELCQWAGVSLWFWFEFLFVLSFSLKLAGMFMRIDFIDAGKIWFFDVWGNENS